MNENRLLVAWANVTKDFIKEIILPVLKKISIKLYTAVFSAVSTILTGVGIIIGIAELVFSVQDYLNTLSDLKKGRNMCYGMYRRIKALLNTDTNKLCYDMINKVCNKAKSELEQLKSEVSNNTLNKIEMTKKYFLPCEFNSFVLVENILSYIETNEIVMTIRNGSIKDYVTFVSIQDYIDTHEIFTKDKVRIETYIFDNNVDMLNIFALNLQYLKEQLELKYNTNLTEFTRNDIKFVLSKTNELLKLFTEELLDNLKTQNTSLSSDVSSLLSSVYRYLDFGYAMQNSLLKNFGTLIKPYFETLDINEYCLNVPQYPLYLFSNYFLFFGNIIYNDLYIANYKTQILNLYKQNPEIYDKNLINQIQYFLENCFELEQKFLTVLFFKDFYNKLVSGITLENFEKLSKIYTDIFTGLIPTLSPTGKLPEKVLSGEYELSRVTNIYGYANLKTIINNTLQYNNIDINLNLKNRFPETIYYGKYDTIKFENNDFLRNYLPFYACIGIYNGNKLPLYGNWWDVYADPFYEIRIYTQVPAKIGSISLNQNIQNFINSNLNYYHSVPVYRTYELKKDIIDFINKYPDFDSYFYDLMRTKSGFMYAIFAYVSHFTGDGMTSGEARFRSALCLPETFGNDRYNEFLSAGRNYYFYDRNWYTTLRDFCQTGIHKSQMSELFNPYLFWKQRKDLYDLYNQDLNALENYKNDLSYQLLQPELANPEYNSILSAVETTKDNMYIFNLFKSACDLIKSNVGYYMKTPDIAFTACYKDNDVMLVCGYDNIYRILKTAYERTSYTNMFYLLNKNSLDKLFGYAQENFENKISMYDYYRKVTPDYTELIIKYNKAVTDIEENFYKNINSLTCESILNSIEPELIENEVKQNNEIINKALDKTDNISYNKNKIVKTTLAVLSVLYLFKKRKK